jgi:hypothetical protein
LSFVTKNEEFIEQRRKSIENLHAAVIVASSWDGVGSALMPSLISQFKALNVNSLALAILPSKVQPSDVHFNALSSMGLCVTEDFSPIILTDRDLLESFVGVNRDGSPMAGNIIINYLLELMLTKGTLVQEISELSRSFNVKMYTVLLATGASLKMYDSLENILNSSLSRPLLTFELSSASVLYVLIRMPLHLKDKLPRGKIELRIANWFKEKASLKSIYVTEPIYVDDYSDRIDIAMFVGGFNATERFTLMEKKVKDIKTYAIKKGFIKEDEWQGMIKNLIEE